MTTTLIHADSRRRINLGKAIEEDTDYRMTISEDGSILLEPIIAVSRFEMQLLADPARTAALDAAIASGPGIPIAEIRAKYKH